MVRIEEKKSEVIEADEEKKIRTLEEILLKQDSEMNNKTKMIDELEREVKERLEK